MSSSPPAPSAASGYLASQSLARGLGPATSTSIVSGDRRKIHTSFTEKGSEMVEEYDLHTDAILIRKLRHKSSLGAWGPWIYEIGEPVTKFNADKDLILESSNNVGMNTHTHTHNHERSRPDNRKNTPTITICMNSSPTYGLLLLPCFVTFVSSLSFHMLQPLFVRIDTPTHFQFRIRNLPYDYENYILEIEDATQEIVLKTKNKKSTHIHTHTQH